MMADGGSSSRSTFKVTGPTSSANEETLLGRWWPVPTRENIWSIIRKEALLAGTKHPICKGNKVWFNQIWWHQIEGNQIKTASQRRTKSNEQPRGGNGINLVLRVAVKRVLKVTVDVVDFIVDLEPIDKEVHQNCCFLVQLQRPSFVVCRPVDHWIDFLALSSTRAVW